MPPTITVVVIGANWVSMRWGACATSHGVHWWLHTITLNIWNYTWHHTDMVHLRNSSGWHMAQWQKKIYVNGEQPWEASNMQKTKPKSNKQVQEGRAERYAKNVPPQTSYNYCDLSNTERLLIRLHSLLVGWLKYQLAHTRPTVSCIHRPYY